MKTRAVIFDLFGTVIRNLRADEYHATLYAMAAAVGAPPAEFAAIYGRGTWEQRATGVLATTEDAVRYTCQHLGVIPDEAGVVVAVDLRVDLTRRALVPLPGVVETLRALKADGLKIGLVSDCTAEVPLLWAGTVLAPLIDAPVLSCVVGLKKPDPRIYRLCLECLDVESGDCIYVGDGSDQELSGAQAVGLKTVLVRTSFAQSSNPDRPEALAWRGLTIDAIPDVLDLVD